MDNSGAEEIMLPSNMNRHHDSKKCYRNNPNAMSYMYSMRKQLWCNHAKSACAGETLPNSKQAVEQLRVINELLSTIKVVSIGGNYSSRKKTY